MRLKLIKIAGFKSFVEPTKLVLPSNLIGIVGPNGCGKSNTLDAVRWVMGESSAKQLRGGDMNDVLFNGTDKRQPVSQCSVELVFDNEAGLVTGEFASFSEISVKRIHHREEGTSYFLNQQKVRRRDVLDLFNGTGLGPRSYALIGQGNISRIIEAKPEDMRVYLEEVAGIGPYKSRRKETLVRLERTRENLAQLAVLQEALSEQAINLEVQAAKALQYREAVKKQKSLKKSVFYLQWQARQQQLQQAQNSLKDVEQHFAHTKFAWDQAQKNYLLQQQQQPELQQQLEQLEAAYHQADKDLLQATQQQAFASQQSQQWLSQQQLNQAQAQQFQQELADLSAQLSELAEEKLALEYELERIESEQQQQDQDWLELQNQQQQANQALQAAKWQLETQHQKMQQLQNERQQTEQSIEHQQQQLELLQQQTISDFAAEIADLSADSALKNQALEQLNQQLAQANSALQQAQQQQTTWQQQLAQIEKQQQGLQAELQALQRIETLSLQAETGELQNLLAAENPAQQLFSRLEIEPQNLQQMPANIYFADQDLDLLKQLNQLDNQAWLQDSTGIIYQANILIQPNFSQAAEALNRKQRISEIELEINDLEKQAARLYQQLASLQTELAVATANQAEVQTLQQQANRDFERLTDQISHLQQQQNQAQTQFAKQQDLQQTVNLKLQTLQAKLQDLELDFAAQQEQLWQAEDQFEQAQLALQAIEIKAQPVHREQQTSNQIWQRSQQNLNQLNQNLGQLKFQQTQLKQQLVQNQAQAKLIADNLAASQPEQALEIEQLEQQLADLKQQLTSAQQANSELNQQLAELQLAAETRREINQQAHQNLIAQQLQIESLQDAIQTLKKSVEADGLSIAELSQIRLEQDKSEHLEAELKLVQLEISRLGAVNMTAIEEFDLVSAKLKTLETQLTDLTDSIEALEQAIATIDKDSRARLTATFDEVNQQFSQLFPKLFNGGNASLSWQDEQQDPLEGGVEVMAQPPGKRNSRIALLSGGEKTLSALALIFAIFQLKPAPFCILDEVDAPLDDANVLRFCNLVKSLAEKVQFIFITHNKTTMTLAQHLIGVTMHEAGVSRLVSVDLDAAVAMIGEEV